MNERLLDAGDVAELLKVTKHWVYAATRADRIPHVRLGRYVRYQASEIERWVDDLHNDGRRRSAPW